MDAHVVDHRMESGKFLLMNANVDEASFADNQSSSIALAFSMTTFHTRRNISNVHETPCHRRQLFIVSKLNPDRALFPQTFGHNPRSAEAARDVAPPHLRARGRRPLGLPREVPRSGTAAAQN